MYSVPNEMNQNIERKQLFFNTERFIDRLYII